MVKIKVKQFGQRIFGFCGCTPLHNGCIGALFCVCPCGLTQYYQDINKTSHSQTQMA